MRPWARYAVTACAAAALAATPAVSVAAAHPPARVSLLAIEQDLMCTECHEPLDMVSSPEALSEKQYVQVLIAKGDTKQQIFNAMVAQYGVAVLGKPPASGFNLLIYILPPAILLGGVVFLVVTLPRWRERSRTTEPLPVGPVLAPDLARRIDDDLDRMI